MKIGIVLLDKSQRMVYQNDALKVIWPNGLPTEFTDTREQKPSETVLLDGRIILQTCQEVFAQSSLDETDVKVSLNSIGYLWIFEDITIERNAQKTIQYLAEHDSLTGLYNRRSFDRALKEKLKQNPHQPMALVYVDLDNFKLINDLKGHARGDKVLMEVAHCLVETTRETDLVARVGGDEFVILISDIRDENLSSWCDRLITQLSRLDPNALGIDVTSSSVGIAVFPRDGQDAQSLMASADQAMYEAKRAGKNTWRAFSKNSDRHKEKVLWNLRQDYSN
jgi:diguanylate cyclase (GGDEF)-like protein